jgi:zinc protease
VIRALFAAALAAGPALPPAPDFTPPTPSEGRAAGVRVLVLTQGALPLVHGIVSIQAGAELDPPDRLGRAALVASYLAEGGAGGRSATQLAEAFAALGTTLEAQAGGPTAHFNFAVQTGRLAQALALAADVVARPAMDGAELEAARKERLAAVQRMFDEPANQAELAFVGLVFGPHPYGRPLVGTLDGLRALTLEEVRAFHAARYGPQTTTVILVGQVELPAALEAVEKAFGGWQSEATPPPIPPRTQVQPTHWRGIDRPGAPQTEVRLGYASIARDSPDLPAMWLLEEILGGSFTSRLNQNLREKHGYTYGVGARFEPLRAGGVLEVSCAVRTDVTGASLTELLREFRGIGQPLAAAEVAKGKAQVRGGVVEAFSEGGLTAAELAQWVDDGAPLEALGKALKASQALDPKAVSAAARRLFVPRSLSGVLVGDRKAIDSQLAARPGMPKVEWTK